MLMAASFMAQAFAYAHIELRICFFCSAAKRGEILCNAF